MKKEEVSKFYLKYRLYIFPAVVALSSLILIISVIYPQVAKLLANQKVETEIINKSKFLEAKAQTLESLNQEELSKKVDFAVTAFPTDKDFVTAINLLQSLTAQSGFNTVSMSLGTASSKTGNVQSYSFRVDLLGPTALLPTLLNRIESTPRLIRVSSIETSINKNAQASTISLNLDVLYSSAPTGFGSIDSPVVELSEKDEEVIVKLARSATTAQPITSSLGPRGKANPFE